MTKILKFTFFLIWVVGCSQMMVAQDLILKKDGTEVYGRVIEVTPEEIFFRVQEDTSTGEAIELQLVDVFMIKYENGRKDVFYKNSSSPQETAPTKDWTTSEKIHVIDNAFFYKEMKRRDNFILYLLEREGLHEDSEKYRQGWKIQRKGSPFITIGSGLMGLGAIFSLAGVVNGLDPGFIIAGSTMMGIGTPLLFRGVDLKKKGKQTKREAVAGYNRLFE